MSSAETAAEVTALLMRVSGIEESLGHDDIPPKRKRDPAPAFPMDDFRTSVAGILTSAQQG